MADQILKDNRGIRFGKISTDTRGNATIYDKMNIKLGMIKVEASGNQVAYNKLRQYRTKIARGLLAAVSAILHKNPRESTKDSLRFLFRLTKNPSAQSAHNLCAVLL